MSKDALIDILAVQTDIAWEDRSTNFARVRALIEKARPEPESLVVLPEMFATGFSMAPQVAEPPDGPTCAFLAEMAVTHRVHVLGGVAMQVPGGPSHNVALAFNPDGDPIAVYAKRRPFRPGGEVYAAGTEPVVFTCGDAAIAPLICYDLRFPEVFRDVARLYRPEVFVVIASWPEPRIHHWLRLLQARAIENQAFVIGVNRCGQDPTHRYPGRSVIVDPHGEIFEDAGTGERTIAATLDLSALVTYRKVLPFLDDL
jgi:predicted amidohydrolase